jgi:natural product precursor
MVSKSLKNAGKKKKIKVLNLNKETVKDLTDEESKRVKGGTTQCLVADLNSTIRVGSGIRQTSGSSIIIGQSGGSYSGT